MSYKCTGSFMKCNPSARCRGCGFEAGEAKRRKSIPFTRTTIDVPFTDWGNTGKTEYIPYEVELKFVGGHKDANAG